MSGQALKRCWRGFAKLKQSDFCESAVELFGERFLLIAALWQVGRCVLGREVAPALERAAQSADSGDDLIVEHDTAAADAVISDLLVKADDALAGGNLAFDDPIDRAAIQDFIHSFGPHAGLVVILATGGNFGTVLLPRNQLIDVFGAHGELHHVNEFLTHRLTHHFIHRLTPERCLSTV